MKRASIITLIVMAGIVLAGTVYILLMDESEKQKRQETPAANALLIDEGEQPYTDLAGQPIQLADDFGNVLVVTSWASWCPQCKDDLARLDAVAQEFAQREVSFLAINRAEDTYSAERYLATITRPSYVRIVLDPDDHFFAANTGYAMPETLVYSREGNVLLHQRGSLHTDELKQAIEKALE